VAETSYKSDPQGDQQSGSSDSVSGRGNARRTAGAPARRWIQPSVLSRLGNLELLARAVVDGLLTGLHRSPHFGFSQEFAEYRAYNEGDDLRFVDWNVYARTDKTYIKRFRGDTNTSLTLLLDASGSMAYGSQAVHSDSDVGGDAQQLTKFDYARYLIASLAYLASKQHDAVGLVVFDDTVKTVIPPSSRPDTLPRIFAALESAQASSQTNIADALDSLHTLSAKRGLIAVVSDFYTDPESLASTLQPLVHRQQDMALFHVLDPAEIQPQFKQVVSLSDLETGERTDVDPQWMESDYRERLLEHCEALESRTVRSGVDYKRIVTDEPLDDTLQRYLLFRQRKQ